MTREELIKRLCDLADDARIAGQLPLCACLLAVAGVMYEANEEALALYLRPFVEESLAALKSNS